MNTPKPPRPRPDEIMTALAGDYILAVNRQIQVPACNIVLSTISMWLKELIPLDREAASSYFLALAVLADPSSTPAERLTADRKRIESFDKLVALSQIAIQKAKPKIITPGNLN